MDFEFNNGPFDHGAADLYASCEVTGDGAFAMAMETDLALLSVAGDGAVSSVVAFTPVSLPIAGDGALALELALDLALLSVAGDGIVAMETSMALTTPVAGEGAGSSNVEFDLALLSVAGDAVTAVDIHMALTTLVAGDGAVVNNPIELVLAPTSVTGYGLVASTVSFELVGLTIAGDGLVNSTVTFIPPTRTLAGNGLVYAAPAHVEFNPDAYQFETITVTRAAQDALWSCQGRIDGLTVPRAYLNFTISASDHNDVSRKIFFGFVPGRDYAIQVAANKSMIQGYDAGFYLTRQFLPDGDLSYPHALGWTPMGLIKYWLGEETLTAGCPSEWEIISGIKPYRIHNPTSYGHGYTDKDFVFQPTSTKVSAIQEVCEYSHMIFLVKWNTVNDIMVPCAYLVHEEDIDDVTHGLDLPAMVDITDPDDYVLDSIRVTEKSDERYNRIIVRSSTTAGGWLEYTKQTQAVDTGDEFPIEYLEERSDLTTIELVTARAEELYTYYTEYAYNYTLTLINRTDLELYQRCRFYSYGYIPEGTVMRIVAIQYVVKATHTEVQITVTPDSRLSDLKRLEKSSRADAISTIQTVAKDQIEAEIIGTEMATVATVDDGTGTVDLERGDTVEVRYIEE